jgi:hypothetical protein
MLHVPPLALITPFGGGYVIEGSANFADAGANHHNWTPAGTGDSRTVMTLEVLFKLFSLATDQHIFAASDGAGNNIERFYIDATGNLHYEIFVGGVTVVHYETTALFRDFSAWYQVVVIRNGNTVTLYVNGTAVAAFDTSDAPTGDNGMFGHTEAHYIGRKPWTTSGYLDLAIARLTYQDGVAASISDYGSAVGSGWQIADVSGLSLGTNGVRFQGGDVATGFNSNGDGTDEKSASGDWTGTYIGNFSFSDGKITMGTTNDQSIYSTQTFAGDFEIEFIPNSGTTDTVTFGVVETAELSNILQSHAFAHSGSITDGTYFMLLADKCYIRSASSLVDDASGGFSWSAGDKIKLTRTSGTIKVYVNGSLAHTFSQTNSNTMMMIRGGGNQSGVGYVTSEVQWNDGGSLSLNGFKTGTITATNDSPTDSTDGSGTYGNYANFNDEYQIGSTAYNNATYSQGGTHATYANGEGSVLSQAVALGNGIYFEATLTTPFGSTYYDTVGFIDPTRYASTIANIQESAATGYSFFKSNGQKSDDGATLASYGSAWDTAGKVIGVYISPTGKVWYTIDGTLQNSATESEVVNDTGTSHAFTLSGFGQILPVLSARGSNTVWDLNCGQFAWNTTPYSGYAGLLTANLPAPTVTDPSAYFQTLLWTGDSSSPRSITGFTDAAGNNITPDFVWVKSRSNASSHTLWDSVRGGGGSKELLTDSTSAEGSQGTTNGYLSTFDAGGFSVAAGSINDVYTNESGRTYAAWCMKAGGSGSSNTDGSISSTISVADHNGFAIIKHTNTSGDYTVGHGMGQAPDMLILKGLGTQGWLVWTADLGVDGYLALHSTAAVANPAGDPWSDTSPTSSVFTIAGTTWYGGSSFDIVTYAFARTPGLIGIGSYTGNGSADGPYVVVDDGGSGSGFRPAWVMIKRTDSTGYWDIHDNARNPYNVVDKRLHANAADTEATAGTTAIDFVANGFKIRTGSVANINVSGGTYIYLAFAEYPFGGEGISQARAR